MTYKTLTAALAAAVLALGMTACDRDNNAGAGSSVERDKARSGSAASGSSTPSGTTSGSASGSASGSSSGSASKSPAPAGSK
ncbi:MAG TPA: hypothetical protein VFK84_00065 [Burkholderiales bacterium]|nr:hypothetical protein [Burkholderiales bacterium]